MTKRTPDVVPSAAPSAPDAAVNPPDSAYTPVVDPLVDVTTVQPGGQTSDTVAVPESTLPGRGFVKVNLKETICLNGVVQGPGECWVPEDAFAVWGASVIEPE